MKYKSPIIQISLTGVLTALAILMGAFAYFPWFGGVYLVGAIVFLMPLILKFWYSLIGTLLSVFFTDLITGWIQYTWISLIAYSVGIIIIFIFSIPKIKLLFIPGLFIASLVITGIYFVLLWVMKDRAYAIFSSWGTMLQFAIVIPLTSLLYLPIKILGEK